MPEIGAHQLEVVETLIGVGRFLVIFVAARLLAELLVRWQLPTILGLSLIHISEPTRPY